MLMASAAEFKRLRAPQEDGQKLVDPPEDALPALVAHNRQQFAGIQYDVQGRSLAELATSARRSLFELAIAHTRQYRDVTAPRHASQSIAHVPLILSGHQPQLFHPGVWYKNFVLGRLARRAEGVGIHLLIDSDLCRSVSIRVPTGSLDRPRVESVAYDVPFAEVPFEERVARDEATFASFGERLRHTIEPFVRQPIIESLWPLTLASGSSETNLGVRLAQGRHALEAAWHNGTLELPQSAVCQLPEFAWFVAHLLAQLPRFWSAQNDALAAYRRAHHLRNWAHPVPDLAESDGWLEAPFWLWTKDDPHRRPLFARSRGNELEITDRYANRLVLPLTDDGDASLSVERLIEFARRGVKLRTRALTTTLFARLVLSDLFLHGIGGAKYDQVTDQLARQFFGFAPPEFAAVSATLRLPIRRDEAGAAAELSPAPLLRELRYHPERFVAADGVAADGELSSAREIIDVKRRWIETRKTPANARDRHLAITGSNDALQPFVVPLRKRLEAQIADTAHHQRADAILSSREYSFCLYPREHLERLLLDDEAQWP